MKANRRSPWHRRQTGISLVEIMVAMVISLLLILGVGQIYLGSKASYRINEGLARVQEAGRFATGLLSRTIRMAGYQGCMNRSQLEPRIIAKNVPTDVTFGPDEVVNGEDNVSGKTFGSVSARDGTDVLVIRHASPIAAKLAGNLAAANSEIQLTGNPANFEAEDVLFITDCADADIFRATSVSVGTSKTTVVHTKDVNTSNRLSKPYQDDAMVMAFESHRFFIGDTTRDNQAGQPIYALYAQTVEGGSLQTRPLLNGVENLQVLYGEDTDADGAADTYSTADAVGDFANVISVRVELLVSSIDPALTEADNTSFDVLGTTVTPNDRQLHKTFTLTATIRNRELRSPTFGS